MKYALLAVIGILFASNACDVPKIFTTRWSRRYYRISIFIMIVILGWTLSRIGRE